MLNAACCFVAWCKAHLPQHAPPARVLGADDDHDNLQQRRAVTGAGMRTETQPAAGHAATGGILQARKNRSAQHCNA
jgi:hypothetical protein